MKKSTGPLKELIKSYELMVNNDLNFTNYPSSQGIISIIDLTLSSLELGLLYLSEILKEYLLLLNYKFILLRWEDIDQSLSSSQRSAMR